MNVMDAIKSRYSVRRYKDKSVEEEKLNRILEAGRLAPSAKNRQEWRYVVVRNEEKRHKLIAAARNQKFIGEAPVVIVACSEDDGYVMRCGQKSYPIDVAISLDHMTLAAVEEGLGTCWIGAFYEEQVRQILNVPENIRVVELLTLGYPNDSMRTKRRMAIEEIVMYEEWQKR